MLTDVLGALARVPALDAIVVVTADPAAREAALAAGAEVLDDTDEAGQSPAARDRDPPRPGRGSPRGCCSCPATRRCSTPLRSSGCSPAPPLPGVTIVPDRHGTGTNALCSTRPT